MNLVIFDIETTGYSPRYNEITQIAAVRMKGGKILRDETFSTFVKTSKPVPWHITNLTGITNAMVRNAPTAEQALWDFSRFIGRDATLVAHNGRRFDSRFITETCSRLNFSGREIPCIDTLDITRSLWSDGPHNIDSLVTRLGVEIPSDVRRHDARGDVYLLASCLELMLKRLKGRLDSYMTHFATFPSIPEPIH